MDGNKCLLQNDFVKLVIDPAGGAFTQYCLKQGEIDSAGESISDLKRMTCNVNPLDFKFLHKDPSGEFEFKGHFLCLGNWGDPSPGELKSGLNKHGEFARINWELNSSGNEVKMSAGSALEGIEINREIKLARNSTCIKVSEVVKNTAARGRIYNMVQHPTIAGDFLNERTIVNCNATSGYDYLNKSDNIFSSGKWPLYKNVEEQEINLESPKVVYNSVFPTIIDPGSEYGWISAYSPDHHLLLGYLWKRSDYPWINHWIHFVDDQSSKVSGLSSNNNQAEVQDHSYNGLPSRMIYRGLEFGTTGMHMSFKEIIDKKFFEVFGEKTFEFLDSGESKERSYYMFLIKVPDEFFGVEQIKPGRDHISIRCIGSSDIQIAHSFN
jgi:hypothetical protein